VSERSAVLVVDDDESIREFIKQVLIRSGFEVVSANDGIAAIEKIAAGAFDAIILDLKMPRLDGFGVLRYLHDSNARMVPRTVVATASPRDAANRELRDICRILVKPFDAGRLIEAIRECLSAN
jgi:CheY-like chemotaxis protein